MTIDNHPLTPKSVDDRGSGVGDYQPTKADREALEAIDDALGFLMDDERAIVLQAFARHREQAERGLREALQGLMTAVASSDRCEEAVVNLAYRHAETVISALDTRP